MTTGALTAPSDDVRSELSTLVRLSLPIAVAQLGLVAMGLVDTAILGRVSVPDLAGSAMGRSIGFAVNALAMGIVAALEPLASQAIGAKDDGRAWAAFTTTLRGAALVAVPTIVLAFAITLLLGPLGIEPDLAVRARWYLAGAAPGMIGFVVFLAAKTFLQAHGETRPALVASLVANVVNFVACSVLVGGDDALAWAHLPPLGLRPLGALGAGIATSIGNAVLSWVLLRAALRHRPPVAPEPVPLATVVRLGLPVGLQLVAEIGVFSFVSLITGRLGAEVLSAHQIALGLASFTFMASLGVSGATAVRVGHAIGAGRSPRRAGLLGIGLGACVMLGGAAAFASAPAWLMRRFTPDPGVVGVGVELLFIAALFQLFDGVQVVAAGALRGAGDVRYPFVVNLAAHWLVGLPIALFLGFGLKLGARGLWWGLTAGLVTVAVLLAARFVRIASKKLERV